jgi:hypothetical protein
MSTLLDLYWIISDLFVAACNGLNLWPAIILSLFIGMMQLKHRLFWLKAMIATALGMGISLLLPLGLGLPIILPDPLAFETLIQLGLSFCAAYSVILGMHLIKNAISLAPRQQKKIPHEA